MVKPFTSRSVALSECRVIYYDGPGSIRSTAQAHIGTKLISNQFRAEIGKLSIRCDPSRLRSKVLIRHAFACRGSCGLSLTPHPS